jgi:hypothetical protein
VVVDGVGPGSVLAERYTLGDLVRADSGWERWTAQEPDLARSVSVVVVPSWDERAPALLDAARVAAGLDIPGCVRVLDIGADDQCAWVVEESLEDSRSVADLLHSGGLPGDEVRRIAGEAATALEAASARGVHHLRIAPEEVFRSAEGTVKVRGLATAAALARVEEDSAAAARTDAIGLVALTYAALTGLWPLDAPATSLPRAPRLVQGVPAPSEIAAGVPRDIDTLCRLTLADGNGPSSPGDYAQQIAPWSSRLIHGRSTLPAAVADPTAPLPVAPAGEESAQPGAPTTAADAAGSAGASTPGAVGAVAAGAAGMTGTNAASNATGAAAQAAAPVTTPATTAAKAPPVAPPADSSAAPTGAAAPRPRPVTPTGLEPPAPGVPAEPLTKDESKVALAIVGAFVLLSLLVGLWGVSRIGSQSNFDLSVASRPTPKASASSAAPQPAGPQPMAILSADGFDPLGDKRENNQLAPKVFDGDPSTVWTSEGYRTPNLGGLKDGVGVIVDLGPNITPQQVNLTLGAPADVSVYFASDRTLDGALLVGELTDANGTVSVPVPAEAAGRQYLIVWFTKVSQVDGAYRAVLGEVSVLG